MNTPMPTPPPPPPPPRPTGPPQRPPLPPPVAARAEATFNSALQRTANERPAYLAEACADDDALHAEVMALLKAHDAAGSFMRSDAPLSAEVEEQLARLKPEEEGECIGLYKLREQIGEGGFGTVWVADQEKPVRRRVALKIIKLGMDTKEVIARFEQERQALAMMDHANIAKVLDAGATQWGRPYFVMELVRGIKITDYCDQQQLSTAERIALFIRVCQAVQHAHQKGIIHRDLKPSNILVTINDGEAVPKVIDFGVAKATQGRLSERTVYTQFQQMIGTPLYMSPEQAEMTSLDIDTRSDIYSLGVLLYELLTGHTPIEQETLARVGLDEIRRVIREVDPPRPSTRVKSMEHAELTSAARQRHMDASKLTSALRGDLDWIVMKALEKNRNRRYDTANGLAMDLLRHMQSEPVLARPPSFGYKAGKFIRKHRGPVVAAAAVVLALIAGLIASTLLYFDKKAAWASESRQKALAETEANKSQQVARFLQDILKGVGPQVALGQDARLLRKIMDDTAERVGKDLKEQPATEAFVRETLGEVYFDLGQLKKSEEMFGEALRLNAIAGGTTRDPMAARILIGLGHTLTEADLLPEAEKAYREALALNRSLYGELHEGMAKSLYGLGEVALNRADLEAARRHMSESLDQWKRLGKEQSPEAALTLNDLGLVLIKLGNPADAETLFAESLAIRRKMTGEKSPQVAESHGNLGLAQWYLGRLKEAGATQRKALALKTELLPETHPDVGAALNNLSLVLRDSGELDEAEAVQRRLLDLVKKSGLLDTHRNAIQSRNNLAVILRRRGAQSGDLDTLRAALQINPTDPLTADAIATVLTKPLIPILSDQQWSAAAWRSTRIQPDSNWMAPDFKDDAWTSGSAPHGSPTFFPRKPNTPITSHPDLWLRREFIVSDPTAEKLLLRINRNQDARIFLNGVPAAPAADWSDTYLLMPCTVPLKRGRNLLAVHCQDADGDAPIDVRILATTDASLGRKEFIKEFGVMIDAQSSRADLYAGRASAHARLGQWADAAADLTAAIRLSEKTPAYWHQLTALLLKMEDQSGYQRRRQAALQLFAKPDGPDVAGEISRLALLSPARGAELEAAVKLAEIAGTADYPQGLTSRQVAKGLAEYRNGQFESAIDWMGKALATAAQKDLPGWNHERERNRTATAWLVQAMAHRQLGQTKKADEALSTAADLMDHQFPKVESGDLGREWADLLFASILRREAEAEAHDAGK